MLLKHKRNWVHYTGNYITYKLKCKMNKEWNSTNKLINKTPVLSKFFRMLSAMNMKNPNIPGKYI